MVFAPLETLIIAGSARFRGNTAMVAEHLARALPPDTAKVVSLLSMNLRLFSYDGIENDDDDFLSIIGDMTTLPQIVFVTPVYWYSMSATMKNFFDRLTELLHSPRKRPLGRALAGRKAFLAAVGGLETMPSGFAEPFSLTAAYLGMAWGGSCYLRPKLDLALDADEMETIRAFANSIVGSVGSNR